MHLRYTSNTELFGPVVIFLLTGSAQAALACYKSALEKGRIFWGLTALMLAC